MSEGRLKTAVLGLSGRGGLLLEAARGLGHFEIQAVADKDSDLAGKVAEKYSCPPYDDYRQLVIQNQLDCLLVAAPTHSCDEHIKAAMKKKANVLKVVPPARTFEEAAELVALAEDEAVLFGIASTKRFARGFVSLREFLQQGRIEKVFLITGMCSVGDEPQPPWQTDPKRAGGGVLLQSCYELVDQMVLNLGVPEQVYALNTSAAGDKQQRLSVTEDTALVTMKFSDTLIGNVIASRRTGSEGELLKVYGKDRIATVGETGFSVTDDQGQVCEEGEYKDDELSRLRETLENFALSILSPDDNKLCSSGREGLRAMAVIESAYLSARTGAPEEPGRILQMASQGAGKAI
jgi:predicted dehydrogenase